MTGFTDELEARVRDHTADPLLLDLDAIIRGGRRRRRTRQLAATGGVTALAGATVGATIALGAAGHTGHTSTIVSANQPSTISGLAAEQKPVGHVDNLAVSANGWLADAYVDKAGDLCEGWVSPTTSVMTGACGDDLVSSGPTNDDPDGLVSPLEIEPDAAAPTQSVDAFGLTGAGTTSVTVTNHGASLPVVMSTVHTAAGRHAFLISYPLPHIADWVDNATARDASGAVVGRAQFVAPDTGQPSTPLPTPTGLPTPE